MWFPRPENASDVAVLDDGAERRFDRARLLALLRSPSGEEWRDRVGVTGNADGSAKVTTRLLRADGWVFKLDLAERHATVAQALEAARRASERQEALGVWHPSKRFFALRTDAGFHTTSVCRELITLRRIETLEDRLRSYERMLAFALGVAIESDVGLDVNPSNFAIEDLRAHRLYYLDDEVYRPLEPQDIGEAACSRLPEEDALDETRAELWGRSIAHALSPWIRGVASWEAVVAGVEGYPITEKHRARMEALSRGIRGELRKKRKRRGSGTPRRTCVLADVHANLPALEAVLESARAEGCDSYLFLGDAVGYGPHPDACVERLAELPQLVAIQGNHDRVIGNAQTYDGMNRIAQSVANWSKENVTEGTRRWLRSLPKEHSNGTWLAVHGAPRDPEKMFAYVYELTFRENLEYLAQSQKSLCFYGHTHVPFVHRRTPDGAYLRLGAVSTDVGRAASQVLVNPGSVGQPRDGDPRAAFLLWDRRDDRIAFERVSYPLERTLDDMVAADFPRDLVSRLEIGR